MKRSDQEWQKILSPKEYEILRKKDTEPAFSGMYYKHNEEGTYLCKGCGQSLFTSKSKYHSGSGWPSFYQPILSSNIEEQMDHTHGMTRTEVICAKCGSHLGHVFNDGPQPTGLRYCINSAALSFKSAEKTKEDK